MTDTQQALMVVDAEPPAAAAPSASGQLFAWNDDDLQALRQTVAKDCNDSQFKVFVLACRRLGLDPFARQIVPIVQGDRMTPQVTIDGFRLISERTGKYAGMLGPFWCGKDGVWRDVWLEDGPPTAAKVGIRRRDFDEPTWGVCRYKSYAKGGNWNTMPDVMTAKVAEALGRRITFPQELSGVYTEDEMDQAREDAAAAAAHGQQNARPPQSQQRPAPRTLPPSRAQAVAAPARASAQPARDDDLRAKVASLRARAEAAGVSPDDWAGVAEHYAGTADALRMRPPGLANLTRYVESLEREHAAQAAAAAAELDDVTDADFETVDQQNA